jgi:aminoglycoside phosphotransferase (APT) family kinase protein
MTEETATLEPFSADAGLAALRDACAQVGLDPAGAELLRLGQNALFTLADGKIVVRVARSVDLVDRVTREVDTARWLAEADFPAVRLVPDLPQPIEAAGRLVTFWQKADDTGREATTTDLGRILRDLHALPEPSFPLKTFNPLIAIPERFTHVRGVDAEDLAYLESLAEQVGSQYRALCFGTPQGFIHGDAHRSNLIVTPDQVLLADFDWVARGPREWDLTPTAVAAQRFGLPEKDYAAFADAYGRDVLAWTGYPTLRAVREVTMTTWLMQNVTESPEIHAEFRLRVRCLREGDHDQRWRAF